MSENVSPKEKAATSGASPTVVSLKTSKKTKVRKGAKCSWCEQTADHTLVTSYIAKRNKFQCSNCLHNTIRCRNPACKNMSRAHRGWHEGFCIDHNPLLYNEKEIVAHCSWCFENSTHEIHNDSLLNFLTRQGKIFSCKSCYRPTQHCTKCEDSMSRFGDGDTTKKCFKCCGLIDSWNNPEQCKRSLEKTAFCPWCMTNGTHSLKKRHKSKDTVKDIYMCDSCTMETKRCNSCNTSMCLGSSNTSTCSACKNKTGVNYWAEPKRRYDQMCAAYNINAGMQEMHRKSEFYVKALKWGLLRPFLLIVSMHPQMRCATAYKLDIPLVKKPVFGNPHAEADLILFHPKKGLQRRSSAIFETIGISTKCNWYQILRRALSDIVGQTTFKSRKADKTAEICSDPSSEVLNALEMELLEHIAQRYLNMFPPELRDKAVEFYEIPHVYQMFQEMRSDGVETDSICVMFVAIVISSGMRDGNLNMDVSKIQLDQFIDYLRDYIQGQTNLGNNIKNAQFASKQVVFFVARVVVVGTLLQVVSVFIFPPMLPVIQIGLLTLGISMFVAAFVCRPSRDISCQAVILIVFQHFLLSTQNVDLRRCMAVV